MKYFNGKKGDDLQLWLEEYEEASNYQWKDNYQTRWFPWFIERTTKVTWLSILKLAEKAPKNRKSPSIKDNMEYTLIIVQLTRGAMSFIMNSLDLRKDYR